MSEPIKSFNRIKEVSSLLATPYVTKLNADAAACGEIALRFNVSVVEKLSGEMEVTRRGAHIVIEGRLNAALTRTCVVSLEEFTEYLDEAFSVTFSTKAEVVEYLPGAEIEVDLEAPEPLTEPTIDLAEILIEQVSLAMDPYPRKEGAVPVKDTAEPVSISPFAVLAENSKT